MNPVDLPVAILAGGLATRLRPITEKIPKLLVEVAGEPFFSHQLRMLRRHGLTRVVACIGYRGEMIVERYGDGRDWGLRIEYSFDGPTLLGTGGALMRAKELLGESFLVLYGDSYLRVDYPAVARAFLDSGKSGLMTVFENRDQFDASNVMFANGEIRRYDKKNRGPEMKHIDYGLGALHRRALDGWPTDQPVDLADIYGRLVVQRDLAGYEVFERFYEIGSPSGLRELDEAFRSRTIES